VVARYGALGLHAQRLARGEDDTRFTADALPEALEESVPLEWAAESLEPLLFAVKAAVDRLCARLAGRKLAAVKLMLHLKLDPLGHAELPLLLARPSAESKKLLELFRHRLQELSLPRPVSALTLKVVDACDDPGRQLVLGDGPEGDAALEVVLSKLSSALGEEALFSAALVARHRPEAGWDKAGFHPPADHAHFEGNRRLELPPIPASLRERPSRLLQRPVALEVQVSDGGALLNARVLGRTRKVTQVFGPERLCGDWWGNSPYSRDYYRVQFEGVGALWLFRDAKDGRFYLQGLFD
jgi:protein ImuB